MKDIILMIYIQIDTFFQMLAFDRAVVDTIYLDRIMAMNIQSPSP